jgi:hypothetical protein
VTVTVDDLDVDAAVAVDVGEVLRRPRLVADEAGAGPIRVRGRALVDAQGGATAPPEQVHVDLAVTVEVRNQLHLVAEAGNDAVVVRRRDRNCIEILPKGPRAVVEPEARVMAGLPMIDVIDVEQPVAVEVGKPRPVREIAGSQRRARGRRRRLIGAIEPDRQRVLRERDRWIWIAVAGQARRFMGQWFAVFAAPINRPKSTMELNASRLYVMSFPPVLSQIKERAGG